MTKEQLAASLDGCQYREEVDGGFDKAAKEAGLIIVFGASDDLMEFRGAINDEIGAWNGTDAVLYQHKGKYDVVSASRGHLQDIEDCYEEVAAREAMKAGNVVAAKWSPPFIDTSWLITTDLPHATFDVMEDGELYCRGVVIDVKDLK